MDLKDIAAVSGKGGLFKVLKPTRTGVILETIDESKTKLIANANSRVSLLKEISVYTTSKESSMPLESVFKNIYEKFGKDLKVTAKSEDNDLKSFLQSVVPDYDTEKVYNSDIKKIVSWYSILIEHFPDIFKNAEPKKEATTDSGEDKKIIKADKSETKEAITKAEKKPSKKEDTSSEKPKAKTSKKK